ncbi:hypothetical protein JW707_04080 [Candidatus Woesearchaeota archaeon]|nr:hypothetical protein [Candidatus Woesearchaeota archaeon]
MKSKKAFEGNILSIVLVAVTVLIVIGAFVFAIAKLGKQAADIGMPGEEGETCSQKGGACYDGSTCPQGKTKESGQCAQGKVCCS